MSKNTLTAKATDNSDLTKMSSPINITVGIPAPTVLLVVSSAAATLNASDAGIKAPGKVSGGQPPSDPGADWRVVVRAK